MFYPNSTVAYCVSEFKRLIVLWRWSAFGLRYIDIEKQKDNQKHLPEILKFYLVEFNHFNWFTGIQKIIGKMGTKAIQSAGFDNLDHVPYSPGLASRFTIQTFRFTSIIETIRGTKFGENDAIMAAVDNFLWDKKIIFFQKEYES